MRRPHAPSASSVLAAALLGAAAIAAGLATGCSLEEATAKNTFPLRQDSDPQPLPPETNPPITYGAISRGHTAELENDLQAILQTTVPTVSSLLTDLDGVVARLTPPPHLATTDPVLKTWRQAERDAFQSTVDGLYAEAEKRLKSLQEAAMSEGLARAVRRAPPASPLDAGPTGEPSLDTALQTFDEVIEGAVGLKDLSDRKGHDRRLRVDLFESFSSFGLADAEAAMGGRLLLFVGGDETTGAPAALLAFHADEGTDPKSRSFAQVFRHRIMRGSAVVKDLGWRPAPVLGGKDGQLRTETLERYLIAPDCQPTIDTHSPSFDQLRDMRIVVDIQSAVFDAAGKLLGGVDWRLEFQVSANGDLTWQLAGGKPVFDKGCAEVTRLLRP